MAEEDIEVAAEREQTRLAMALGQLVHGWRTELGLSQEDLVCRLGVSGDR